VELHGQARGSNVYAVASNVNIVRVTSDDGLVLVYPNERSPLPSRVNSTLRTCFDRNVPCDFYSRQFGTKFHRKYPYFWKYRNVSMTQCRIGGIN